MYHIKFRYGVVNNVVLLFCIEKTEACEEAEVLNCYARGTGQLINPSKCSIMLSPATPLPVQASIKATLQVDRDSFEEKYLGFPTPEGRMNKGKFQSLQEKVWKRVIQWGENFLSSGGKEILIKAVLHAILVYVMGIFKLPDSVCDDLNKLIRNFWWGADNGRRKTHWRS